MPETQRNVLTADAHRVSGLRRDMIFDRDDLTDLEGKAAHHFIQAQAYLELAVHSLKLAALEITDDPTD